ncbi:MAG TPA: OsmC family protein [Candidatus Acidoferrales bacterium]|nr:OsmC family protein [Candidatus Acidoferrales bacterium]
MEKRHEYRLSATFLGARGGVVHAEGIEPAIKFYPPPEFLGRAGEWTPEHFLVASVASCYVSTFSGIAEVSKFQFLSLKLDAAGVLSKDEGGLRFTEIKLHPVLVIAREEDRERAVRLLEKAERSCLIARSLTCKVVLDLAIHVEEELLVPEKA